MVMLRNAHSVSFWENVVAHNFRIPEKENLDKLTYELMDYLHSTDPGLRDDIAYQTLTNWIIAHKYTPHQLRAMINRWRADLHKGLGEINMPGAVTRSFAALMLSIIAYHDWKNTFLTKDEVRKLVNDALMYLECEEDLRGYDPRFGWIHATAHTADLLKYLARNNHVGKRELWYILEGVTNKVTASREIVFTHSEEDRLAWVVIDVLKRDLLPPRAFKLWLNRLADVRLRDYETDTGHRDDTGQHGAYQNTKHFLRAVYMRLILREDLPDAAELESQMKDKLRLFLK